MTKPNSKNRKRIRSKSKLGNGKKRYLYKYYKILEYFKWLERFED